MNAPDAVINLAVGQPSSDLLRPGLIGRMAADCFADLEPDALNYGDYAGDRGFLEALAAFLERHYGEPVAADGLFLTAGASHAIDLACRVYCRPGDTILVEEPSYFLALEIFASQGLRTVPVTMDEEGVCVHALAAALDRHPQAKLLYTIPLHHNPTSVCMSAARRDAVLGLARERDVIVLADEVYQLLHCEAPPPPRPFGVRTGEARVLSVGSFSKILAPAMRVGWIQADPQVIARLSKEGMILSGGAINQIGSLLVRSGLRSGLQETYLTEVVATLASRIAAMQEALVEHMPASVRWQRPSGGYFFWLHLPPGVDAARLLPVAQAHGTGFHPGRRFSSADALDGCLRLSFARYREDDIREGVRRLGAALRELLSDG